MNKKSIFPFVLTALTLTGCPSPKVVKLEKPILTVNEARTGLTWESVSGAISYQVSVNESEPEEATSYAFSEITGNYSVCVRAVASEAEKTSDYSDAFIYETKKVSLGDLSLTNGIITWSDFLGIALEYKVDNGQFTKVNGSSLTATTAGVYTIRATGGYDEENHIFYAGKAVEKMIVSTPKASSDLMMEDGSEDGDTELQEKYEVKKYTTSGWADSTCTMVLSEENGDLTPGKCVEIKYYKHGSYFSFNQNISLASSYEGFSLYAKAIDDTTKLTIAMVVKNDKYVGTINLKGAYIFYTIDHVDTNWCKYTVSFDDENWKIDYGGTKLGFNDVLTLLASQGYKVNSIADLLPLFESFEIRVLSAANQEGSSVKMFIDELQLLKECNESSKEVFIDLLPKYDLTNETAKGTLTVSDGNKTGEIKAKINGSDYTVPVALDVQQNVLTVTSTVSGMDFVAEFVSQDGGLSFELESVTGTLASLLTGAKLTRPEAITYVDDFESYSSTGVGYDQNHKSEEGRSGLREKYYSDYYGSSEPTSPLGGPGWTLMGSSDYLDLNTEYAHTGSKSIKFKYNSSCAMRMISWDLYKGTAQAYSKGTTFSFWAKGGSHNVTLKVRVFTISKIDKTTHVSNDVSTLNSSIVIAANSDWTEYKVTIDSSKIYYGFSFTTDAKSDGNTYFYIDDITVYGNSSPWAV